MPFLLTDSDTPLLLETVPALKITHYYGKALQDNVYAYLRCFVQQGSLHCCFTCFAETPPPGARMSLCFQTGEMERTLLCTVGKHMGVQLFSRAAYGVGHVPPAPVALAVAPAFTAESGGDEQGIYWGVRTIIPAEAFRAVLGKAPKRGMALFGNLFLHNTGETAFGAAFPVPEGECALTQAGFDAFPVVPY